MLRFVRKIPNDRLDRIRMRLPYSVSLLVAVVVAIASVPFIIACTNSATQNITENAPHESLYLINADGSGQALLLTDSIKAYWGPAWSPDGMEIVFSIFVPSNQSGELYLADPNDHNLRQLTHNGRSNYYPAWSPDGKTISFISQTGDVNSSELYTVKVDGGNEQRMTNNDAWEYGSSWSPDGKQIAFGSKMSGDWQIYLINSDGSNLHPLQTTTHGNAPTWSPDGRQIAFISDRDGDDDVYVMNVDGSNQYNLTNNDAWDDEPSWSPYGQKIAFVSDRDGTADVFVMNSDGSDVINLSNSPSLKEGFPSWSPYGKQIVFHAIEVESGILAFMTQNASLIIGIGAIVLLLGAIAFIAWQRVRLQRRSIVQHCLPSLAHNPAG